MNASILSDLPKSIGSTGFDSVCLGIITEINKEDHFLFIHRGLNVPSHKDQLAFIGGHHVEGETDLETASREFEEELNISPDFIEWYGTGSLVFTRQRKTMLPVYLRVDYEELRKSQSNGEWDFACFYPLKNLLNESTWSYFNYHYNGETYPVYLFPMDFGEKPKLIPDNGQELESFILWGATARVVWNFKNYLLNRGKNGSL